MRGIGKRLFAGLLTAALCLGLLGCGARTGGSASAEETENLVKLCKVWGYVKYRHPAFLLGKKDWDQELLELIPQVREAKDEKTVNALLHTWFEGLGEVDYGTDRTNLHWTQAREDAKVISADTAWASDADYLGEALAGDLAQIEVLPSCDRSNAPLRVDDTLGSLFNEPEHEAAYDDPGFRLLGLFRLWNAAEYCQPYLGILDQPWASYLPESITMMLEGADQASYERALAFLGGQLHDPHVIIGSGSIAEGGLKLLSFAEDDYWFPVQLAEAEGKLVVSENVDGCPLERGDVLEAINGKGIDTLLEERRLYECWPREDSVLNRLRFSITASSQEEKEVAVLRDGRKQTFSVQYAETASRMSWEPEAYYEILEGNVGLINPGAPSEERAEDVMEALWDTAGLVIDLRQYPDSDIILKLDGYLLEEREPSRVVAHPTGAYPGAYLKVTIESGPYSEKARYYDRPVVLLMSDDSTQSYAETEVMILSRGKHVVTMGENSAGGNGGMAVLPLPGGLVMTFSGQAVYTPEGECTQRVGIAPDIPVSPTIQGIAEGRDELLEAAVEYIKMLDKS